MRAYLTVSGLLFAALAIVHAWRLISGWPAHVAGYDVPMAVSWLAIIVTGGLAIWAFRLRQRTEPGA